jgi:exodeoxyribonuclease III
MRIATWNINGLRSAVRGEFEPWLAASEADVVCLQEAKVEEDLLTSRWFDGYEAHWFPARRPGYAGVATLVRDGIDVISVERGVGDQAFDDEGRVLSVRLPDLEIVNVYAPHSHRTLSRLDHKLAFITCFDDFVDSRIRSTTPMVIVGDLNVAHLEIDVANSRQNKGNAGFLPEERAWLNGLLERGMVDAFRAFDDAPGRFTWWSMRKGVRERNVGWRLDYALVDERLASRMANCFHQSEQLGSDHCPVILDLD